MPSFRYLVDDLSVESEADLRGRVMSALARLALFCMKRVRHSPDLLSEMLAWAATAREALDRSGRAAFEAINSYILRVGDLTPEEWRTFLAREVGPDAEEILMTTAERLRQEGREEGRAEGRVELLVRQLTIRFGPPPADVSERVRRASSDELDAWAERVLTAESLHDVLGTA